MVLAQDLLNPTPQAEARKHKLKALVPAPRSFFMDVKWFSANRPVAKPDSLKAALSEESRRHMLYPIQPTAKVYDDDYDKDGHWARTMDSAWRWT
ncbi:MAG: 40S ribosomal protein S27 [Cirrosporium novae-zelandiae]|nr:MAG: 40S ribosomal protein S27 [Cirrosporium novae-zelandiae]